MRAIYRSNDAEEKYALRDYIRETAINSVYPWILLGDFNHFLDINDRIGSNSNYCCR